MANPTGMRVANCVHCGIEGLCPIKQINWWCRDCDRKLRPWAYGYVRPTRKTR